MNYTFLFSLAGSVVTYLVLSNTGEPADAIGPSLGMGIVSGLVGFVFGIYKQLRARQTPSPPQRPLADRMLSLVREITGEVGEISSAVQALNIERTSTPRPPTGAGSAIRETPRRPKKPKAPKKSKAKKSEVKQVSKSSLLFGDDES